MQLTLAEFIREGHYASHIRRMRLIYGKRRAALVSIIKQQLGESFLAEYGNAGLHLILALPESIDDVALSAELEQKGTRPCALWLLLKSPRDEGCYSVMAAYQRRRWKPYSHR